ncbi:hypothetical protein LEP1GSC029_2007, partial [Leptospira interrogans str. 2002000626]
MPFPDRTGSGIPLTGISSGIFEKKIDRLRFYHSNCSGSFSKEVSGSWFSFVK